MKVILRGIRTEFLKMRHTLLYPLSIAIPLLASGLFLLYYRFAGWSEQAQISGYMELAGMALPFLVSVLCAGNIRLEEQNHFQVFLGSYPHKWNGLAVKGLALAGLCLSSISSGVFLFGTGYRVLLGKEGLSASWYLWMILVLFLGSVPLYLEHLFWNLQFSGTISQCVGVSQSLLSALFLTGLGEGRWKFFPCTWSARGVMLLCGRIAQNKTDSFFFDLKETGWVICPLLFVLLCAIIGLWFHFYEGRQCND